MGEVTGFLGPSGSQSPLRFVVLLAQGESGPTQLFYFFTQTLVNPGQSKPVFGQNRFLVQKSKTVKKSKSQKLSKNPTMNDRQEVKLGRLVPWSLGP